PFDVDVQPDFIVLTFTAGLCLVTTILVALVPAARSTRVELTPTLRQSARGSGGGRSLSRLLVIGQLGLSVPLLILAGVFVRSLASLERLDVGYSRDNLIVMKADISPGAGATNAERLSRVSSLLERLRSIPGVLGATVS